MILKCRDGASANAASGVSGCTIIARIPKHRASMRNISAFREMLPVLRRHHMVGCALVVDGRNLCVLFRRQGHYAKMTRDD
jgi:hypothetical protein